MVRIFGHHIAVPVAVLVLCELCLFLLSLTVATWIYPTFAHSSFNLDLLNGSVTGFYPYPFLEVRQLGYERVLLNMGLLTAAFAVLGLILVGIDRLLGAVELRKAS